MLSAAPYMGDELLPIHCKQVAGLHVQVVSTRQSRKSSITALDRLWCSSDAACSVRCVRASPYLLCPTRDAEPNQEARVCQLRSADGQLREVQAHGRCSPALAYKAGLDPGEGGEPLQHRHSQVWRQPGQREVVPIRRPCRSRGLAHATGPHGAAVTDWHRQASAVIGAV